MTPLRIGVVTLDPQRGRHPARLPVSHRRLRRRCRADGPRLCGRQRRHAGRRLPAAARPGRTWRVAVPGYHQALFCGFAARHLLRAGADRVLFLDADEFVDLPDRAAIQASLARMEHPGDIGTWSWRDCIPDRLGAPPVFGHPPVPERRALAGPGPVPLPQGGAEPGPLPRLRRPGRADGGRALLARRCRSDAKRPARHPPARAAALRRADAAQGGAGVPGRAGPVRPRPHRRQPLGGGPGPHRRRRAGRRRRPRMGRPLRRAWRRGCPYGRVGPARPRLHPAHPGRGARRPPGPAAPRPGGRLAGRGRRAAHLVACPLRRHGAGNWPTACCAPPPPPRRYGPTRSWSAPRCRTSPARCCRRARGCWPSAPPRPSPACSPPPTRPPARSTPCWRTASPRRAWPQPTPRCPPAAC